MERQPVESSQIVSVGYDPAKSILEIEFRGAVKEMPEGEVFKGPVYQYFDVLPETHQALMDAQSAGRYFGQQIRGKFKFAKLPPPAEGAPK